MAATLYAALGGGASTSDLYTVDPATAAMTSVGPIGFALTGLAQDPTTGTLYGLTSQGSSSNPNSLITIDPTTGAGTLVVGLSGPGPYADIAFDSAGVLYAMGTGRKLATINKATGVATLVGTIGAAGPSRGNGMSIDSTDTGYTAPSGLNSAFPAFYSFVPATGFWTNLGSFSGYPGGFDSAALNAASFDPSDVFYGVGSQFGTSVNLITVDTATVAHTIIGSLLNNTDALAWVDTATGTNDFDVSVTPDELHIAPGGSDTTTLDTNITSGVTQSITLSATGQPTGVTVTFTDNPIDAGDSTTVDVDVDPSVPAGVYTITIHAVGDDTTHTTTLTLYVAGPIDDDYTVAQGATLNVAAPGVLGNDIDPTTAVLDTDVASGTLALNADGSFSYTPDNAYVITDSFTYTGFGGGVATVTITVESDNHPIFDGEPCFKAEDL